MFFFSRNFGNFISYCCLLVLLDVLFLSLALFIGYLVYSNCFHLSVVPSGYLCTFLLSVLVPNIMLSVGVAVYVLVFLTFTIVLVFFVHYINLVYLAFLYTGEGILYLETNHISLCLCVKCRAISFFFLLPESIV